MTGLRQVALVGPRGAGKTTLASALGRALGWPVLDGDDLLAAAVGAPAGDYLAKAGEAAFRAVEERVTCGALASPGRAVVALGGGAVLSTAVRRALAAADILVVFLVAQPEVLVARLGADPTPRPALTDLPRDREVQELLQRRLPLYREVADLEMDTGARPADECVAVVLEAVAER